MKFFWLLYELKQNRLFGFSNEPGMNRVRRVLMVLWLSSMFPIRHAPNDFLPTPSMSSTLVTETHVRLYKACWLFFKPLLVKRQASNLLHWQRMWKPLMPNTLSEFEKPGVRKMNRAQRVVRRREICSKGGTRRPL